MKQTIIIITVLALSFSCKAQSPIFDIDSWDGESQENAYYKDLNNFFNAFEGTWVYTNGSTSLKVDNFSEFIATLNQDLNDIVNEDDELDINASFSDKEEALNEKLGEDYGTADENQQEKAFLEFFKKYGISLYKANEVVDNWSKIDLTAFTLNASGVVETPCE